MITLPEADWQSRDGMPALLSALAAEQGETRFVGGCVRDGLLGLQVNDVDLATRLHPEEVIRRLKDAGIKAVPTGLAHGTVTAILSGHPVEITTLRRDVATDGRRATIAYTDDWKEDAARRDFTINALSADPATLAVFDYFDGEGDLEARRVRFIGDPYTRIAEDHLRILRFFRFHARFGGAEKDQSSLEACAARANDLMALSRERIADELLKLLALADPFPTVSLMIELGIFRPVLPEITDAGPLAELVRRERETETAPDPLRRLAVLLPADEPVAVAVAARLRLSNRAVKRLASAANSAVQSDPRVLAYRIGREEAVDRILLRGEEPHLARQLDGWERPRLGIGGGELIQMGLAAGPLVAKTLHRIEQDWAEAGFPADGKQQRRIARRHVDQALNRSV
jgi:poly(A) polymerase